MKKIFSILFISLSFFSVKADEGMWLVQLIGEKTYADMVKKGLKLTKEQLYSANKNSIKDAIVLFGGGCTAEIVSKEGLVFTNHHCGYGSIAAASSVAHNYLQDGFWAKSKQEEIASPGLSVQFLLNIEDVSDKVNEKIKDVPANELAAKLPGILATMSAKAAEGSGYEIRIGSFFKGNQFLQFTYQRYTDVRLVGAPPESIGKFGGDTDNWEWPRHTGDFSIFRVYMSKDGKPADYSADNIPYVPKHFLPVSIKGVKDGDFSMIYGYPGGTNRYETSYGVKLKIDIENPFTVSLRDARLKLMMTEMLKDPANKIQLASYYAQVANYWKFFDGETKQLIKYNVIEQKQKDEAAFEAWAKGKPEYDNLFANIKSAYDNWRPYAKHRVYITEGIMGSPLLAFAAGLRTLDAALKESPVNQEKINKSIVALKAAHGRFLNDENVTSDRNILAIVTKLFYTDIDASQRPQNFYTALKNTHGSLEKDETYENFAKQVFENTMILNKDKWAAFISKPDTATLHKDLAYSTAISFLNNFNDNYGKYFTDFNGATYALNKKYLKGVLEMKKGKAIYPDANQTMRISYGNVKSYSPKDGVNYNYVCTLNGVMEKYIPGDYEFDAPAKLIELIKNKDYGQYVDKATNDIVVTFITTDDITGGNSGSPVINAKGELIGLAFDGNYEALSHKIAFDKNLNRTICVDVRFVLFIIEKLGGAKNIIDELVIMKN
ncbi:MAG: S46 family peptidase [Bacteroidota bacterium]|nr:S46 family peptidase [Bacteroidota bacterium]MDP3146846.1 S46 family peptidase [Bacteroidota bacterium]